MNRNSFLSFLIRAKHHTYAGGGIPVGSSRPGSHDLHYSEDEFSYIDTYLGGFHFIGEEAAWHKENPVWGMNYYGKMLAVEIPEGFSEFLKAALMQVPFHAPYRGPVEYISGNFTYRCMGSGEIEQFEGKEEISVDGISIYKLTFHGGEIRN